MLSNNQIQGFKSQKKTKSRQKVVLNLEQMTEQKQRLHISGNSGRKHGSDFIPYDMKIEAKDQCEQNGLQLTIRNIKQKVRDVKNEKLYPQWIGPHFVYTIENTQIQAKETENPIDLRQCVTEILNKWVQRSPGKMDSEKKRIQDSNGNDQLQKKVKDSRLGVKYNKYSLEFKMNVVTKIHRQLKEEQASQKSLRYYIVKQANQMKIHPKNIARWFETKNLERREGGRKAKLPKLEYELANFIKMNPNCKRKEIMEKAKNILSQSGNNENFNFSKGWYERFKTRLKIHKVQRSIQLTEQNENSQK